MEVALRVSAVDGAATPPQAARRFRRVVAVALARRRRSPRNGVRGRLQGEEGAGLVERRAQRRRARAMADEVEQVAMLTRRAVGELPGRAGTGKADVKRAPAGAVEVAGDPVAAVLLAVRQVPAAHGFGARAERGGDGGGVHDAAPADAQYGLGMMELLWLGGTPRYRPARPLAGAGGRAARA